MDSLTEIAELERHAEQACRTIVDKLRPALQGRRDTFPSEDYLVYAIHDLDQRCNAPLVLTAHSFGS